MTEEQIRESLSHLAQLEVDAAHACERSMAAVDALAIRDALGEIRRDHQRHAERLARAVVERGGSPPHGLDLEGRLMGLLTVIRGAMGTEGALRAFLDSERLATGQYARALTQPWQDDVLAIIRECHADERRHLATVERWLAERAWEAGAHP